MLQFVISHSEPIHEYNGMLAERRETFEVKFDPFHVFWLHLSSLGVSHVRHCFHFVK